MNLTLSIDENLLKRAREAASARGKSVNQLVREYLEQLSAADAAERDVQELKELGGTGRRRDWRFNRDELHERA